MKSGICLLRSARRWGILGFILALLLAHLVLSGETVSAQSNLVPNPSFESYSSIPTGISQINLVASWSSPTNASPDYYHALATVASGVSVPANFAGTQQPHTGQAYAGFYARDLTGLYREYVETPLTSPLIGGQTYSVSFYVSLADQCRWAVDKIGAYLSVGQVGHVNIVTHLLPVIFPFTPQINNPANNYIINQTGWTLISGQYTASGGEDHLVIGNFFDDPSTIPVNVPGPTAFSYYYLDDVSVNLSDFGDAPDSTNHFGVNMTTGYSPNNTAHFPTVYDPASPGPAGPLHLDPKGFAWLGSNVSLEDEADAGSDEDLQNNIDPLNDKANQDLLDDSVTGVFLPACQLTSLQFSATNASTTTPVNAYINVWFDWSYDGDWDDQVRCAVDPVTDALAPEWAVQNYVVNLAPGFNPGLLTPPFRSHNQPGQMVWMRITLTDVPIDAANNGGPFFNSADLGKGGSGPLGGYQFGETEDYFISSAHQTVSGMGVLGALALVLGLGGALFFLILNRRRRILS
jgi:hypothetical protein